MEQKPLIGWFGEELKLPPKPARNTNPMIEVHGAANDARAKCKDCKLFVQLYAGATIYKCLLRGVNGKTTDHSSRLSACAKFERRRGSIEFYRKA